MLRELLDEVDFAIEAVSYTHLDVYKRQGAKGEVLQDRVIRAPILKSKAIQGWVPIIFYGRTDEGLRGRTEED